jgi:predicted N-acetyltransferase YhbS
MTSTILSTDPPFFSIGPQLPVESNALAELITRAFAADRTFGERRAIIESYIPALILAGTESGRALSLVARASDGRALGHALWYPYRTSVRGRLLDAWCLAPLAVDPDFSRRGIGSALMRASIAELESRGASLAFLLGHDGYYPRFGFKTGMFGQVGVLPYTSDRAKTIEEGPALRAPRPSDESALRDLWRSCFEGVDFALEPERGFMPWMAWASGVAASVLEVGGAVRAYARYRHAPGEYGRASDFLLFLAADAASAELLLAALGRGAGAKVPFLPLHPRSAVAMRLFPDGFDSLIKPFSAAMVRPLRCSSKADNSDVASAVEAYCEGVASGSAAPGIPLFPPIFDSDDRGC